MSRTRTAGTTGAFGTTPHGTAATGTAGTAGTAGTRTRRRRTELAAFLRSRRARVTPADVGMPPGLRRRTPGLRREEVAQLSGVGVTWYTWLEQGRPINASAQVLDAVARTLRLDAPEREHLYRLAEVPFTSTPAGLTRRTGPEVQGIIDAVDPLPAAVYNSRYDILATNPAYRDLFLVPQTVRAAVPNVLWALCTLPEELCPVVRLDVELPLMVATLRSAYGRHVGEPVWEEYIRGLAAESAHFARLWASGEVAPPGPRVKTFRHPGHPGLGEIRMTTQSLSIDGMPECRIVVYTPVDEEARAKSAVLRKERQPMADELAAEIIRRWNTKNPAL